MEETKPSALLLYPNTDSFSEQNKNAKILVNNKFNNNNKIIVDISNFYETETSNKNKKFVITEILLSSIATTATSTSVALTGIGLPYSIPTAFAKATVCDSLSKTNNTKIGKKI